MLNIIEDVRVLRVDYEPGDFALVGGIKQGQRIPGDRVVCGGNGTYGVIDRAHLILVGEKNGEIVRSNLEIQIRQATGRKRITQKFIQKLKAVLPSSVDLEEHEKLSGEKYLKISEACCGAWIKSL